jgi:hypothetical protein
VGRRLGGIMDAAVEEAGALFSYKVASTFSVVARRTSSVGITSMARLIK